ncbi:MAG: GntR family transcriptional regulator [Nitrospinales bacterium]
MYQKPIIVDMNITDQVHDQLKQKIIDSDFTVGKKINIDRLSLEWDVSKTPIREALRALEEEGLVKYYPRKGYYVLALEYNEIRDIIELRMILETYALEKGFESIDRDRMCDHLSALEHNYDAFLKGEENRYIQTDYQFHMEIIQSAANQRVAEIYKNLKSAIDVLRKAQGKAMGYTMSQHRALIDAILNHDRKQALKMMRAIFEKIQEQFKFLQQAG